MLFLKIIKDLELYLIEFEKDDIIKAKNYPLNCKLENNKYQLIIIIIYNEYML